MRLITVVTLAATVCTPLFGQTHQGVQVFPGHDIVSALASLRDGAETTGSKGTVLGDYQSHSIQLSVRTASGGAEVHAHYDDIFLVTQGKATLITGGTVEDAQTASDGETRGKSIENGKSQMIEKDDIVHIPAGTPHQLVIAPGNVFSTIVVKVKE